MSTMGNGRNKSSLITFILGALFGFLVTKLLSSEKTKTKLRQFRERLKSN